MTAYLTREAAEALRTALEDRSGTPPFGACGGYVTLASAFAILDSLPVVDAVPAEEALDWLVRSCSHPFDNEIEERAAAVRHALRAAKAREDAP